MLVPKYNAVGEKVGSVPSRKSKNPIVGVAWCECREPLTIHNPKGKRSGYYYTICDNCGTDQRSGKPAQERLKAKMVDTVEQLPVLPALENDEKVDCAVSKAEPEAEPKAEIKPPEPAPAELESVKQAESEAELETETNPPKEEPAPVNRENQVKSGLAGVVIGVLLGLIR